VIFRTIPVFWIDGINSSPDLLIYLRSSIPNLVGQIHKRGRESTISIDYLSRLNERYEAWVHTYDRGKIYHRRG
jgi:deoxyadenosine/deoxycytidine kinase